MDGYRKCYSIEQQTQGKWEFQSRISQAGRTTNQLPANKKSPFTVQC